MLPEIHARLYNSKFWRHQLRHRGSLLETLIILGAVSEKTAPNSATYCNYVRLPITRCVSFEWIWPIWSRWNHFADLVGRAIRAELHNFELFFPVRWLGKRTAKSIKKVLVAVVIACSRIRAFATIFCSKRCRTPIAENNILKLRTIVWRSITQKDYFGNLKG